MKSTDQQSGMRRWLWRLGIAFAIFAVLGGLVLPLLTGAWMAALSIVLVLAVVFAVTAMVGAALERRRS
jgi:uncharacterized membrane protein YjjP (DUF1212 family)